MLGLRLEYPKIPLIMNCLDFAKQPRHSNLFKEGRLNKRWPSVLFKLEESILIEGNFFSMHIQN